MKVPELQQSEKVRKGEILTYSWLELSHNLVN